MNFGGCMEYLFGSVLGLIMVLSLLANIWLVGHAAILNRELARARRTIIELGGK